MTTLILSLPINEGGHFRAIAGSVGVSDEAAVAIMGFGKRAYSYEIAIRAMERACNRLHHVQPQGSC